MEARRHPEGPAIVRPHALNAVMDEAHDYNEAEYAEDKPDPDADPDAPPRALELGPVLDRRAVDCANIPESFSPDMREWLIWFRAWSRSEDEQNARDEADDDWNDPILALRRRGRGNRGPVA